MSYRPLLAGSLAIMFFWLALAGFTNTLIWWWLPSANRVVSPFVSEVVLPPMRSLTFSLLALGYGLAALATALGLWWMRRWMRMAVSAWVVSVLALFIWFTQHFPVLALAWPAFLVLLALLVFMLGGMALLVFRLSRAAT